MPDGGTAVRGLLAAAGLVLAACGGGPEARHVVVVSLDTTRADHMGFLGGTRARTPALDALAAESLVLSDCAAPAPTTLASHTSLFTGVHPQRHGIARNGFVVHADNEMLPEILSREGFHTAGFAGAFPLASRLGFPQGFDHWDERFDRVVKMGDELLHQRTADTVTDAALAYVDASAARERWFLFVHYYDPHRPYTLREDFAPPAAAAEVPRRPPLWEGGGALPRAQRAVFQRAARGYASEIAFLDHHVGRLVDGLRERGLLDDALLLVTSDHGETFWEHMEPFDHGRTVYQTGVGAVCLLRLPGAALAGTRIDAPVSTVDLLPTLLAELGIGIPAGIDGEAIPLRGGADPGERRVFGQATKPHAEAETDPRWANLRKARFLREGRWKLIQTPFEGTEELYDLAADPDEQVDLLVSPTPDIERVAARMRPVLEAWAESARPLPSQFDPEETDDTAERLRALGYAD